MSTTAAPADTTTAASTQAAAAPNTLANVLSTAIASVRSRTTVAAELTAARAELATATTERDAARTELATANTQRDTATAQLNAVAAFFGVKPEELAGKDAAAATEIFSKKVSDATIEKVAGLGFPVEQLPKQSNAEGGDSKVKTKAEFLAMSHEDRSKFSVSGGRISE